MTGATPPLTYYPQYCFHLSLTLNKWCPFRASDVQTLTCRDEFEGQNVYFYLNHPIKWVRVAGAVVACNEYYGRMVYTVDDGSGMTVECTMKKQEDPQKQPDKNGGVEAGAAAAAATATAAAAATGAADASPDKPVLPALGDVIGVKGELRYFREILQVQALQIVQLRSTEEEVRFWAKVQKFAADVLSRPWELDRRVVRQCRKDAEKGEDRAKGTRERREETKGRDGKRQKRDTGRDTDQDAEKGRTKASPPRRPPPKWILGSSTGGTGAGSTGRETVRNVRNVQSKDKASAGSSRAASKPPPPPKWSLGP